MQNIPQTSYVLPYFKHIFPSLQICHFRWLSAEFQHLVHVLKFHDVILYQRKLMCLKKWKF